MAEKAPTVLIVDDDPFVGEALRLLLEPDLSVVEVLTDAPRVEAAAATTRPDLVLLDLVLPSGSGLDLAAVLLRRQPAVRIVVFTAYPRVDLVTSAAALGVTAFVAKAAAIGALRRALAAALRGVKTFPDISLPPSLPPSLLYCWATS